MVCFSTEKERELIDYEDIETSPIWSRMGNCRYLLIRFVDSPKLSDSEEKDRVLVANHSTFENRKNTETLWKNAKPQLMN